MGGEKMMMVKKATILLRSFTRKGETWSGRGKWALGRILSDV